MKTYVITQRTEDGRGYYTGGKSGGWAFDLEAAKRYTTTSSANRRAREINRAGREFDPEAGPATVQALSLIHI